MIAFLQPLPVGNAVKVLLAPPRGTQRVRLLRKLADDFAGQDDPDAGVILDGRGRYAVDSNTLVNGTAYYYRAYYFDGSVWAPSQTASMTPSATAALVGPDALSLLRERLEAGLRVEVQAGRLVHEQGYIPCLTAPPTFEGTKFPIVTVHLRSEASGERGLGETLFTDVFDSVGDDWLSSEGWLSRVTIDVVGWTVGNADLRIALRKATKKVIIGNLPVFDQAGMVQIDFSQTDIEDFETYNSPVYETMGSFNCLAPSIVASVDPAIDSVIVDALV